MTPVMHDSDPCVIPIPIPIPGYLKSLIPTPIPIPASFLLIPLRFRFHPGILIPTLIPTPLKNNYTAPIPVPIPSILTPIPVTISVPLIPFSECSIFRM